MLKKLLTSAMFAGVAAGLIAAALQIMLLVPIILEAEEYEAGAKVHFEMASMAEAENTVEEGETDSGGLFSARNVQTILWTIGTYFGLALILVAAFGIASKSGLIVTPRAGILWGFAGFISMHLAPAMGLSPELPGSLAADLFDRQVWWSATVLATALGLAAIAFGKNWGLWAVGVALIAAPHVIGAPFLGEYGGVVPPELAGEFASRSIAVGAISWVSLGLFAGYFWNRSNA